MTYIYVPGTEEKDLSKVIMSLQQVVASLTAAPGLVAALPPALGRQGERLIVTDAASTTFNSVVTGGGANTVPVFSDNANWRIG